MPANGRRLGSWRTTLLRTAAAAAAAVPLLMWCEFLAVGLMTPGYNLLTRAASDLGARGAPAADIFNAGFFVLPGLLTVLFAAGLLASPVRSPWWRLGALLVAAEGVLLLLAGVFSEHPGAPALTARHQLLASICFAAAALAPVVLVLGLPRATGRWAASGLRASALAVLLIEAAGLVSSRFLAYPDGLFQRPFGLALSAWFLCGAVSLWAQIGGRNVSRVTESGQLPEPLSGPRAWGGLGRR